jgi:3-hydroxyacyl-[acyl-carrier-protein] dehydratase
MQGETSLSFAPDHPAFAGHFPGRPIVPGVLLLDAAIHALMQAHPAPAGGPPPTCQINSAKFLSPVLPGETLTLSWRSSGTGQTRFDIAGSDRQVATGLLMFGAAA